MVILLLILLVMNSTSTFWLIKVQEQNLTNPNVCCSQFSFFRFKQAQQTSQWPKMNIFSDSFIFTSEPKQQLVVLMTVEVETI